MTYDHDPARWTASPEEAPELLRGAFAAARNEGPSRAHMRALTVKLAAASAAGGAVAVGTVKAASAGNAIATAATWSAAKIASVIAIAGSVVTGAVIWQQTSSSTAELPRKARSAQLVAPSADPAPNAEAPAAGPTGSVSAEPRPVSTELRAEPVIDQLPIVHEGAANPSARANSASRSHAGQASMRTLPGVHAADVRGSAARAGKATPPARSSGTKAARQTADEVTNELALLQSAQAALAARPRQAFQLTQEHRKLYPKGEFAQERDALAIQALMRAGETENARNLAEAFIRSYPGSPNAHRFREAMGIR